MVEEFRSLGWRCEGRGDGAGGHFSSFLGDSHLKWACKIALWKVASSSAGTLGWKQRGGQRFIRELYSAFITRIWSFMVIIICNGIIIRILYPLVSCLDRGQWDTLSL